ncbi:hypothetical protein Tco_0751027, partial [Tanacetum coccineum]
LHQLDTFYNALNSNDQDSLNSAAGGNFLDKIPRDCLRIIESKSKVRNSRNKPVVAKVSSNSSTPGISPDVAELKDMVKALLLNKKSQAPTPVKAVEESCVTCGGAHSYQNCPATNGKVYHDNIQEYVSQATATNYNPGNTGYRASIANQIQPLDQMVMPYESAFITRSLISNNGPLHQHCSSNKDSLRSSCKNNSQDISDMTPETNAHYESEKEAIHLIMTGIEMKSTSLLMHVRKLKKCGRAIGEVTTSDPPIFKMSRQLILGVWSIHFLTMERQLSLTHKILQDYE